MDRGRRPFNLLRWFGALSFITIAAAAITMAAILSYFLAGEILKRHASQTAEFISTVSEIQSDFGGFRHRTGMAELLGGIRTADELGVSKDTAERSREEFFDHMRTLPSIVSIGVYAHDRKAIWSYSKEGRAQPAKPSPEPDILEQIFAYRYAGSYDAAVNWNYHAAEFLSDRPGRYDVMYYVPLYDSRHRVAAVVQICEEPIGLLNSIRHGQMLIWASFLVAGTLIYVILFWVVRRAAVLIRCQQQRLVESEALAVVGQLALAVAHGIRSPLAAIRSSAELMLEELPGKLQTHAQDIIGQADRLSHWLRDLLVFSEPEPSLALVENVNIVPVLEESVENFRSRFSQNCISPEWVRPAVDVPAVVGNRSLFLQVFNSIIANAVEAMAAGGKLTISYDMDRPRHCVVVDIADTGIGMSADARAHAFESFNTTKPRGLGVGLTLVKRTLERYGGSIRVESAERKGTRVELNFATCVAGL
jgi:two-component system sensor histidine kinase HydH